MSIIGLAIIVGACFFLACVYLGICFVETPDDRVRLITRNSIPYRLLKSGWGFLWLPFEGYYDYVKKFLTFNLEEERVISASDASTDEGVLLIDSQLYLYLIDRTSSDKFAAAQNLWKHGLKPLPSGMVENGDDIKPMFETFVQAMQREVAATMNYRTILLGNEFTTKMQDAIRGEGDYRNLPNNPFVELGITNVRYVVRKVGFSDSKMEEALYALAIAREEGQATIKLAEDKAAALNLIYKVIEQHPGAAAVRAIEKTNNHWVITFNPTDLPKMLGGAK